MTGEPIRTVGPEEYQSWEAVAEIENDRFCQRCGYNLRTNPVRRQPQTELLVARCPECGAFTAVGEPGGALRPWTRRLVGLLMFVWMGVLLAAGAATILGSLANHMISLESRTTYERINLAANTTTPVTGNGVQVVPLANGGSVRIPAPPQMQFQRKVDADTRDYWMIKALLLAFAMLIVLIAATFFMAAVPHWPRLLYMLVFGLVPAIPALIAWMIWSQESPELRAWGTVQIVHTWLAQVAAAVLVAALGRGPLRLLASVLLPGRLRAPLAYLWLVDGRTPPKSRQMSLP